jgi:hypothetical protein
MTTKLVFKMGKHNDNNRERESTFRGRRLHQVN